MGFDLKKSCSIWVLATSARFEIAVLACLLGRLLWYLDAGFKDCSMLMHLGCE